MSDDTLSDMILIILYLLGFSPLIFILTMRFGHSTHRSKRNHAWKHFFVSRADLIESLSMVKRLLDAWCLMFGQFILWDFIVES